MTRYHPFLVVLHWLLAALIIGGLIMGGAVLSATDNADPAKMQALTMHMSIGILIGGLMVLRLITRLRTVKPPRADIGNEMVNKLGAMTHWVLYLVVFGVVASGIGISVLAGLPDIVFFGSGNPLPANFDNLPPRAAHGVLTLLLKVLILGHVLAFLYHQYVRKDGLFSRMWFGNRQG